MPLSVDALDHLVINVEDVEASAAWYQRLLGMAREDFSPGHGQSVRVALHVGRQKINLRPVAASKQAWFTADQASAGSQDLCFLTPSTPLEVIQHLHACEVAVEIGPVEKRGALGMLASVYCRDPDGNLIEISSYSKTSLS
jgi:catechol 2,3-dioxygenase-like lactoylglutathione lyase family enzyme